jgi:preprotein translocase subunit YajC
VPARSAQPTATASNRGTVLEEQPTIVNLLLLYIVVIGGAFIFMTSRGNRKRQSQASQLQAALVEGAQVRTVGGVVGEVVEVTDEHVVVETTPGVRLKFIKSAVAGVIAPAEEESEGADDEETEDDEAALEEAALEEAGHEAEAAEEEEQAEPSDEVPALGTEADEDEAEHAASGPAKR